MADARRGELMHDAAREKLEVLKAEYYALQARLRRDLPEIAMRSRMRARGPQGAICVAMQARSAEKIAELTAGSKSAADKLSAYESLEEELDSAVLQAAEGGGGRMPPLRVPSSAQRRLEQCLTLSAQAREIAEISPRYVADRDLPRGDRGLPHRDRESPSMRSQSPRSSSRRSARSRSCARRRGRRMRRRTLFARSSRTRRAGFATCHSRSRTWSSASAMRRRRSPTRSAGMALARGGSRDAAGLITRTQSRRYDAVIAGHDKREEALRTTQQQQQLLKADLERVLQQRANLDALRGKLARFVA